MSYVALWKQRRAERWAALWAAAPGSPPPPPPVPDVSWSKQALLDWLLAAGVAVSVKAQRTLSKAELLVMVQSVLSEEAG